MGQDGFTDRSSSALEGDLVVELLRSFEGLWKKVAAVHHSNSGEANSSTLIGAVQNASWSTWSDQPRRDVLVAALQALAPTDALLLIQQWYTKRPADESEGGKKNAPTKETSTCSDLVGSIQSYYKENVFGDPHHDKSSGNVVLLRDPQVVGCVAAAIIGSKHPQLQSAALELLEEYYKWWLRSGYTSSTNTVSSSASTGPSSSVQRLQQHQRMTSLVAEAAARQGDNELVVRCIFQFARVHGGLVPSEPTAPTSVEKTPSATWWGSVAKWGKGLFSSTAPSHTNAAAPSAGEDKGSLWMTACIAELLHCSIRAAGRQRPELGVKLFHLLRRDAPFRVVVEMGIAALEVWQEHTPGHGPRDRTQQDRVAVDILGPVTAKYNAAVATMEETSLLARAVSAAVQLHCHHKTLESWLGQAQDQMPVAHSPARALELFRSLPNATAVGIQKARENAMPYAVAAACARRDFFAAIHILLNEPTNSAQEEDITTQSVQRVFDALPTSSVLMGMLTVAALQGGHQNLIAPILAALPVDSIVAICRVLTASPPLATSASLCELWTLVLQHRVVASSSATQQQHETMLLAVCATLQSQSLMDPEFDSTTTPCQVAMTLEAVTRQLLHTPSTQCYRCVSPKQVATIAANRHCEVVLVDPSVIDAAVNTAVVETSSTLLMAASKSWLLVVPLWASHYASNNRLHALRTWLQRIHQQYPSSVEVVFLTLTAASEDHTVLVPLVATKLVQHREELSPPTSSTSLFVWMEGEAALHPPTLPSSVQLLSSVRQTVEKSFSAVQQLLRTPRGGATTIPTSARTDSGAPSSTISVHQKRQAIQGGSSFLSKVVSKKKI